MSNFSKIVILIIIVLSFLFIKEKTDFNIGKFFNSVNIPKIGQFQKEKKEPVKSQEPVRKNIEEINQEAGIYFLALDSNDNGIYKKVKREFPISKDRLEFVITELLKGPSVIEKTAGTYSEIPKNTKLLGIKRSNNKVIIDLSSDFQYGGGTDSIYSRMMQLIKTAIENSEEKNIYLYLDGKQIKFIGGEGIMVTQPLNEHSLDI